MPDDRLRIAFYLPHAAGVFGIGSEPFGGAETGAVTLARGLAHLRSHRVRILVETLAIRSPVVVDGIEVVPFPARSRLLSRNLDREVRFRRRPPFVKLVRPRWSTPLKVAAIAATRSFRRWTMAPEQWLRDEPSDVVVGCGLSRQTAALIRARPADSVLYLMADQDVAADWNDPAFISPYGEPATICRPALSEAAAIIAQTSRQAERLQDHFGRTATTIPNPIDLSRWPKPATRGQGVLWIGRADRFHKRPHLAIELARRTLDQSWTMVLNKQDEAVDREIRATAPPNVTIVDQVPFEQMPSRYGESAVFVTTGAASQEGMPNVLLQANACGVPIVSLEAGAEYLTESRGGVVRPDFDDAATAIDTLAADAAAYDVDLDAARSHLRSTYAIEAVVKRFDEVFKAVLRSDAAGDQSG